MNTQGLKRDLKGLEHIIYIQEGQVCSSALHGHPRTTRNHLQIFTSMDPKQNKQEGYIKYYYK